MTSDQDKKEEGAEVQSSEETSKSQGQSPAGTQPTSPPKEKRKFRLKTDAADLYPAAEIETHPSESESP